MSFCSFSFGKTETTIALNIGCSIVFHCPFHAVILAVLISLTRIVIGEPEDISPSGRASSSSVIVIPTPFLKVHVQAFSPNTNTVFANTLKMGYACQPLMFYGVETLPRTGVIDVTGVRAYDVIL